MKTYIGKNKSRVVTEGVQRAPNRAMLRAVGFKDDDFCKPMIGISSTWSEVTPCNIHINRLAFLVKKGSILSDLAPQIFNTITVSDGIGMGHEGMKYSLPSREIIADSIETVSGSQRYDGLIAIGGCDKNMPGSLMAISRLNIPSIFIYGGTILPGKYKGSDIDIVSVFEAVGKYFAGKLSKKDFKEIECRACPGPGSCGGMYTANTMSSAIEAMGMSLPGSSSFPAVSKDKEKECLEAGKYLKELFKKNIRPKDIMSKKAFENAITVVMALGGSTNAVLHLMAIAYEAGVNLTLDDFSRISKKVPHIADLKPSGKFVMADLYKAGGIPAVMKMLLSEGLINGNEITVTGKTVIENLKKAMPLKKNQKIIRPLNDPLFKNGGIVILKGNLAPEGAVCKITGLKNPYFKGKAIVFNSEEEALDMILKDKIKKGHVVVIRYEGPSGGPGMREMLAPTSALAGRGLIDDIALITDGRFSGGSHGHVVGHISPEAVKKGVIAVVKNGDFIEIDADKGKISLLVNDNEIQRRLKFLPKSKPKITKGYLARYAKLVGSASDGAILH